MKQTEEGEAQGKRYARTADSTVYNNAFISLVCILHSEDLDTFSNSFAELKRAAESGVIGSTVATYTRITS